MKIECHCGSTIVDHTDDLPGKARWIPDQVWFATLDALDDEVIDPLAKQQLGLNAAFHRVREILGRNSRLMWQCRDCGRLYLGDRENQLQCFVPANSTACKELLRGEFLR